MEDAILLPPGEICVAYLLSVLVVSHHDTNILK